MPGLTPQAASPGLWQRLADEAWRIRTRLLLANLLLVAIPIGGIWFARLFEREALRSQEEDMVHQAAVLRPLLARTDAASWRDHEPLLASAAIHTRARIRLLDARGHVVADSHREGPPEGPELPPPSFFGRGRAEPPHAPALQPELGDRPEVARAIAGRYGATARSYDRAGVLFLFASLPVFAPDGHVSGVVYVTRSTRPVLAAMHRLRRGLLALAAVSGVTAVSLSLLFGWTIARRLGRLRASAARIAAGDRTARLDTRGRDEIAALARAFSDMAAQLDARARYIGDFAANVAHEFKSPLTSIRGAAELLGEGAADDPEARARFLGNILGDVSRLDRLVTRLLELSRIEAAPEPALTLDYAALVRGVAARRPEVELVIDSARTNVRGTAAHLESALGNLLDNARRHAPPGSRVTLEVRELAGHLRTTVADRGEGVAPEHLPRIWDRFFTTEAASGGTGLGLAIVAAVVRAHGGEVGVDSSSEGARFWFSLPLA